MAFNILCRVLSTSATLRTDYIGRVANGVEGFRCAPGPRFRSVRSSRMDDRVTRVLAEKTAARPTRQEAEAAVRTLLAWAGDDPKREGLLDTPRRVVEAYEELFAGYRGDPNETLSRVFEEVEGYSDIVVVRDIP